ncbi:MAG: radical SAM protein [Elusimicrobia bacterium]|nr:radical SAM protein [Elusimicrobiota bacterium]
MTDNGQADVQDRALTRERLRREKPLVCEKLLRLDQRLKNGEEPPPVIEIAYRYDCNLKCNHCFASRFARKGRSLSLQDMRELSRQADDLGAYQFILQGGEPLLWPEFDDVVNAIGPKEFYLGLVTNASLLDKDRVAHLRDMGVDKLVASLDSYDAIQYEANRNRPGLFNHTIDMVLRAKEAGLRAIINVVATKQNVRAPQLLQLVEFAKTNGIIVYVNLAAPIGSWEGRYDLLLDKEDSDYIYDLNRKHEVIKRDVFPYRGVRVGCPALRSIVYITQYGDVLPCPFIHIAIGSIFDEPLSHIVERGKKIKWFRDRPAVCLASEDRNFIMEKIARTYGKPAPVGMRDIFSDDEIR